MGRSLFLTEHFVRYFNRSGVCWGSLGATFDSLCGEGYLKLLSRIPAFGGIEQTRQPKAISLTFRHSHAFSDLLNNFDTCMPRYSCWWKIDSPHPKDPGGLAEALSKLWAQSFHLSKSAVLLPLPKTWDYEIAGRGLMLSWRCKSCVSIKVLCGYLPNFYGQQISQICQHSPILHDFQLSTSFSINLTKPI